MKKKNLDQQIITEILGYNKFLMLNLEMVKILGLHEALILTYILDKFHLNLNSGWFSIELGVKIYRTEIESKFGLSAHQQRKAEKNLIERNLLKLETTFDGVNRYNLYYIDLSTLYEIIKK